MNESLLDKKIQAWEDKLLDLGKRNKMISFRETKRSTLKILSPGFDELYRRIVSDEKELTFQKAIDRDSDARVYSVLLLLDKLSCPMEVNIGDIKAEGSLPEIKKTLKHLRSKARLAIDEQGTNILYLVFGFIEWHERGSHNKSRVRSPLILVPVTLSQPSLNAQYTLRRHEDEIVVNPTLSYLFERDYGITLPEFDSEKDTLDGFMQKMEALADEHGWQIARECSMGLVSFLKISMYNDLVRNEEQLKAHPIIRAFAGESNEINTIDGEEHQFDHDKCHSIDSFQVLGADSSQQDAIALSQKGASFVMQGPPGTGKSQTITNIIAQALADGKKILFVSEKMAALDVVYRRLTDVHLADFCLSLHSHKANKKEILNQLGENLDLRRIKVKDEEIAKLTRLDVLREQLRTYVNDIHKTIMPLEMSLYEVYGSVAKLSSLPDIDVRLENVDKMTKDDVNRLALLVMDLDKAQEALGPQWYKNPWQGVTCSYLDPGRKRELRNKLRSAVRLLSAFGEVVLADKAMGDILSFDMLEKYQQLFEHARHCDCIPGDWFGRTTEHEEETVRLLLTQKNELDAYTKDFTERYTDEFLELPADNLNEKLVAAMKDYRSVLRTDKSEDAVFDAMENDLRQISELNEKCRCLIDASNALPDGYELSISDSRISAEDFLNICEMLLEKRSLTSWHFNGESSESRTEYVSDLEKKLSVCIESEQRLRERYSDGIFGCSDIDRLYGELSLAESESGKVFSKSDPEYTILCEVAEFDTEKLTSAENAVSHEAFTLMAEKYGLSKPVTAAEAQAQLSAIEKAKHIRLLPSLTSFSDRERAKQLITHVIKQNNTMSVAKKVLNEFFARFGIKTDVDSLSEHDVSVLRHAKDIVPEAKKIVLACRNDTAYRLLDTIDEKKAAYDILDREIEDLRSKYGISDSFDVYDLSKQLLKYREAFASNMPLPSWANSTGEACSLLDKLRRTADHLKYRREQLLQTYEESVFSLDCIGILNRFKTEYTSLFRLFKSSYKEDMRQIRLAFRDVHPKISDDEIIDLLQTLRAYNEELENYYSFAEKTSELFGIREYDLMFDWYAVAEQLYLFNSVSELFKNNSDAYEFIVGNHWDGFNDMLTQYIELCKWFIVNDEARSFYGSLYLEENTDTAIIRSILEHVRSTSEIFVSPDRYLEYMFSNTDLQSTSRAMQCADEFVSARSRLAEASAELVRCTGIEYTEENEKWQDILSQLIALDEIAESVGEAAGYALINGAESDKELIDTYADCLSHIAKLSEYAKAVYHTAAESGEADNIPVVRLIADIRKIADTAARLKSVYTELSAYCPENYKELRVSELKDDLNAIILYRDTCGKLPEIEKEAREKLGNDYAGYETDWQRVRSDIDFCEKIAGIMHGEIPLMLSSAFINGTELYSKAQVDTMRSQYDFIKSNDSVYPALSNCGKLTDKIEFLERLTILLGNAIEVKNAINAAACRKVGYTDTVNDLRKLSQMQKARIYFGESLEKASAELPCFTVDSNTDWSRISEIFDHLKQVKRILGTADVNGEITRFVTNAIPGVTVASYYEQFEELMQNKHLITDITEMFDNRTLTENYSLSKLTDRFRNCDEQFASMDAWIDLRDCKKACLENGLGDFISEAEDIYCPAGMLRDVFMKGFFFAWLEKICTGIDSVASFRVRTQQSRIEDFRELDSHQLTVDRIRIRERLIREMPCKNSPGRATDEMSLLLHELNKKRNIMPLRKLFRTIPNLLLRLKPCLMMSPLSVSYFLEAETYKFDIVIFDEASQIFPQDAIGAVFRAKQVIIAGDTKQLPPTNFFSASTSNDEDFDEEDDYAEESNFDSILEEASDKLPNRSLLWHYRSRFEELIAFSNRQIYQNNLITFPSSTVRLSDTGVEYIHVKNGIYDNRCNRAEAQEIVRMVAEHIQKHPDRSLGIIAFSESQQSVIEDEINKFRMQNPLNERFFDEDKEEPFFVKNLENVQGDERDTIIFSICYGKNAQGKMYMRFGPLGHQGGERRLNVAITRAKYNIKLVGSILPEDIDLSKTHSEGVRMLRFYIAFAMQGSTALPKAEKNNTLYDTDTFSEQVGSLLESLGYTVKMNVGSSDYTIDIAVEHPDKPGHYIAGIECDGNTYYMARTVRDRDHLRTSVLEKMGWKMHRVWSTEWIRNPEAEKERLISFVKSALLHHGEKAQDIQPDIAHEESVETEISKSDKAFGVRDTDNPYELPLYKEGKWWDKSTKRGNDNLSNIADSIHAVVKTEQPMHMELMYKRVGQSFTTGKATQNVRYTIDEAIKERMQGEVVIEDNFIRLASLTEVQARRSPPGAPDRSIEHISIAEIAFAMEKILVGAYGMDRSVLCSEAAKVFGFERTGAKIKQRTNEAVDYLIRTGKVSDYDNKIQLLEE